MLSRKAQLLDAALEYMAEHGVAKLSLRPLAAELGTSPRMLMFHFTSKEGLLRDVLQELNARLQASFKALASADSARELKSPLKVFWDWAASKENSRYLRLLYEVQVIAIQNLSEFGRYLKKNSVDWQAAALQATSLRLRSEPMATLCVAVFDGLFLELMSTGDHERLTKALDLFLRLATETTATRDRNRSDRKRGFRASTT